MNGSELVREFEELTKQMAQKVRAKNADYSGQGGNADAFANFRMIETLSHGGVSTEIGMVTRLTDKVSRVISLLTTGKEPQVKDESLDDTLLDLSAYALLIRLYLKSKRPHPSPGVTEWPEDCPYVCTIGGCGNGATGKLRREDGTVVCQAHHDTAWTPR